MWWHIPYKYLYKNFFKQQRYIIVDMMTACQSFTDFSERLLSRRCLSLVHGNVNKVQATMYKKVLRKKVQRMVYWGLKDTEKQIRFGNCFLSRVIYGFEIS